MEEKSKRSSAALRIVGIIIVIVAIFAAIIISMNQKVPNSEKIWYEEMTIGDIDAENYFVIYSDIACPYCVAFENAMIEHSSELEEYIKENDVLIEVRATDFLFEFGESHSIESRYSAVATYCAKDEGKFWEFYDRAITKVWNEYFAESGKSAFSEFNKLGKDYWIEIGRDAGLGNEFETCVLEDQTLDAVITDAAKMAKYINGLPYFKFNNFILSGFDLSWGWDYVKMYFDAGLKS